MAFFAVLSSTSPSPTPPFSSPNPTPRRLSTLKTSALHPPTSPRPPSPSPPPPPSPSPTQSAAASSSPKNSAASTTRKSSATTSTTPASSAGARSTATPPTASTRSSSTSASATPRPSRTPSPCSKTTAPWPASPSATPAAAPAASPSPLLAGAIVSSDISAAMVSEAKTKAREALSDATEATITMPKFEVKDLEGLERNYDTVACLDVLIHYPREKAEGMIAHLASLAERRLVLSFAPKTLYYDLLKRVGKLFPGPSKATRAYLHAEKDVERALAKVGWRVRKRGFINTQFYFANLIEAVPASTVY